MTLARALHMGTARRRFQGCGATRNDGAESKMLDINPDTVRFIIERANEFQAKEGVTIPETPLSPSDDWAMQILADHADDPVLQQIRDTVEDLEPDQQVELVALVWLGRGDFDVEDWDSAVEQARESWNERTADYLIGTPLLGDYLAEGLNMLGYDEDGAEIDDEEDEDEDEYDKDEDEDEDDDDDDDDDEEEDYD